VRVDRRRVLPPMSRARVATGVAAAAVLLMFGLAYRYVVSGGMTARQRPWAFESIVAQKLVDLGIGRAARGRKNPASAAPDSADVAAGRDVYRERCLSCHGADGKGGTAAGGGMFPPPADVSRAGLEARKRTDGELFFIVRNGVRNTGMPAWPLSEGEIWDVVAYLRNLPLTAAEGESRPEALSTAKYLGSAACKEC